MSFTSQEMWHDINQTLGCEDCATDIAKTNKDTVTKLNSQSVNAQAKGVSLMESNVRERERGNRIKSRAQSTLIFSQCPRPRANYKIELVDVGQHKHTHPNSNPFEELLHSFTPSTYNLFVRRRVVSNVGLIKY